MSVKEYEDMTHDELIQESKRVREQTKKLIKALNIVLILTVIAYGILILLKLGVI